MTPYVFAAFVLLSGAAVAAKSLKSRAFAVLKALPVLLAAAWVLFLFSRGADRWAALLGAGLVFCAAGDLLLGWRKLFIPGLAAFFCGHLCYAAGFIAAGGAFQPAALVLVIPFGAWFAAFRRRLGGSGARRFLPALFVYCAALAVCLTSAVSFDFARGGFPTASIGAALFCISDALLADELFVKTSAFRDAALSVFYYAAQGFIASCAFTAA